MPRLLDLFSPFQMLLPFVLDVLGDTSQTSGTMGFLGTLACCQAGGPCWLWFML